MPSMDPSLLPPDDGTEPDMECDPTLASCCQREIRDRRTQQAKLDAIRSVMPASVLPPTAWHVLVDKSLLSASKQTQPAGSQQEWSAARAEHGALTEEEIEAALNDADLDLELEQLRLTRMQQLREGAPSNKKDANSEASAAVAKRGALSAVPAADVLDLVFTGEPVVALLTPGERSQDGRKSEVPSHDVSAGIAQHMASLAHESQGSIFVTVAVHGRDGDDLRRAISASDLPAFVCFRSSVIVSIVMGSRLRQFVQMGAVGAAIFRAWLHEARMLYGSREEAAAAVGEASRFEAGRASATGKGPQKARRKRGGDSDESNESDGSDLSESNEEEEEEEEEEEGDNYDAGWRGFVGRTNNTAARKGRGVAAQEDLSFMGGDAGAAGMQFGVLGLNPGRTESRAQTSDTKRSTQVRGCTDPRCPNKTFFHQHIIGGVRRKREVRSKRLVDEVVGFQDPGANANFTLHPHDTH